MALPFLPGYSFDQKLGRNRFHKSQAFDYRNEVPVFLGQNKPGIGGEPLLGQDLTPKTSVFPKGDGPASPAWVAFDRQVLRFNAYFQEAVHELRKEQYRVRKCLIYFYLEDDSIQVIEPQLSNSGIPQGTLIRRHRIPLPPPNDDRFYTVDHFNVGNEITLYSRTFKLTDCDQFTHRFLSKLGVRVQRPEPTPCDPHTNYQQKELASMQPLRPYEKHDTLKQFLEHDREVLRFDCVWDDTGDMFGDVRELVLHYFLADDTIEILERIPPNSGRDTVPMFLKRAKLPKGPTPLSQPGEIADRTVLNVFGPMGHGGRYILDSLKTGAVNTQCYTDKDLAIGAAIDVMGRKVILCDCDDFTKHYYHTRYGIENFEPVQYREQRALSRAPDIPPYNGFGSEEDSLANCTHLIPKPPKQDFIKFMEKDRKGMESNVLRFLARFETTRPIDMDRRFIVSYFLSDDTMTVFEPPQRNSGIIGGKFLERGRLKKPEQEPEQTVQSTYYTAQDLFIGAVVQFNRHKFILINADEFAIRYMEKHAQDFPFSNWQLVLQQLKETATGKSEEMKTEFTKHDTEKTGLVPFDLFKRLMMQLTEGSLSQHEIITLGRHYSKQQEEPVEMQHFVESVRDQLRRQNFQRLSQLCVAFTRIDPENTGSIDKHNVRRICAEYDVPVREETLEELMQKCQGIEGDQVNYGVFADALNWTKPTVPCELSEQEIHAKVTWCLVCLFVYPSVHVSVRLSIVWPSVCQLTVSSCFAQMLQSDSPSKSAYARRVAYSRLLQDLFS